MYQIEEIFEDIFEGKFEDFQRKTIFGDRILKKRNRIFEIGDFSKLRGFSFLEMKNKPQSNL